MISGTRLNGQYIIVNALLIETIEETPDTLLTLTTGKKIFIQESVSEVVLLVKKYLESIGAIRASIVIERNHIDEE